MPDYKELDYHLAAWDLAKPQLLAETFTSRIYTVDYHNEKAILKLFAASETKEQTGALALRYFGGHGAVRLLNADENAQLLEYADGPELVTLVERGADEQATLVIAEVIRQLHSVPQDAPRDGLVPLESWFGELFNKASTDQQAGVASIYVRAAALAERLLADQREVRVLHGDIHHRNIRQSARGWLAFDPKGLVGDRAYDCANTLCNPVMPQLVHNEKRLLANAALLADALALELPRVLAFTYAYNCLNASWWLLLSGGEEIVDWSTKIAAIFEPHLDWSWR